MPPIITSKAVMFTVQDLLHTLKPQAPASAFAGKHIHIVGFNPIMDFNNPTDNPEYPAEWYMALCWGLSKQIAPRFNVPFTPDMDKNYMEAVAMARQANAETTQVYFMPSSASPYQP